MKKGVLTYKPELILGILILMVSLSAFSQPIDLIAKAQEAYEKGSFEKAFELIDKGIPESAEAGLKSQASTFLTTVGISEYNAKNWKNAFDAFRKALKYSPPIAWQPNIF
jgi:tetratricopeptide (TPR) repeat protein